MNYESAGTPSMMSPDRHPPILDAIANSDVAAAMRVVEQHMAVAAEQYAPSSDGHEP